MIATNSFQTSYNHHAYTQGESLNSKAKNLTPNCLSATSFMYFRGRRSQWPMIHSGQWSSLSTIITGSLWWCSDILEIPMEDAIAEASTKCQPGCLHDGRISLYYSFPSPCHPPHHHRTKQEAEFQEVFSQSITGSFWWCGDVLETPKDDVIAGALTTWPEHLHNGRISLHCIASQALALLHIQEKTKQNPSVNQLHNPFHNISSSQSWTPVTSTQLRLLYMCTAAFTLSFQTLDFNLCPFGMKLSTQVYGNTNLGICALLKVWQIVWFHPLTVGIPLQVQETGLCKLISLSSSIAC